MSLDDDAVDPRVQVELERLNAATDEINRLEVDLDTARSSFRTTLNDSSTKIEACAYKLGPCIAKARPYYDARLKAKQALRETQTMASKFERANSSHAAAKEMVYLAEEGLTAEGRTFDHAWQEMLNHATMRVNESEVERTECEAQHKKASQLYQLAEIRVQALHRTLNKAISKSRPYFELRIHYNQLLEKQKIKVKDLEKQVLETKVSYAEALRNLERISDEIHQSRKSKRHSNNQDYPPLDDNKLAGVLCSSHDSVKFHDVVQSGSADVPLVIGLGTSGPAMSKATPTSGSSLPDTDVWSDASDPVLCQDFADAESVVSGGDNDSSMTGVPDSDSESNTLSQTPLSESLSRDLATWKKGGAASFSNSNIEKTDSTPDVNVATLTRFSSITDSSAFDGFGICSFPVGVSDSAFDSHWTEIKLSSSGEEEFIKTGIVRKNDEDFDIPYAPLTETAETDNDQVATEQLDYATASAVHSQEEMLNSCEPAHDKDRRLSSWISANRNVDKTSAGDIKQAPSTPSKMMNLRRQSLDVLWNSTGATGEKMKEIISQGIFKLNIGSGNQRNVSESKSNDNESVVDLNSVSNPDGPISDKLIEREFEVTSQNENNFPRQFGLQFFAKKPRNEAEKWRDDSLGQSGISRRIASPLSLSLSFLNPDEDSLSDTDSCLSVDLLTDEQLSALILDQDLSELYQDILQ